MTIYENSSTRPTTQERLESPLVSLLPSRWLLVGVNVASLLGETHRLLVVLDFLQARGEICLLVVDKLGALEDFPQAEDDDEEDGSGVGKDAERVSGIPSLSRITHKSGVDQPFFMKTG